MQIMGRVNSLLLYFSLDFAFTKLIFVFPLKDALRPFCLMLLVGSAKQPFSKDGQSQ